MKYVTLVTVLSVFGIPWIGTPALAAEEPARPVVAS